MSISSLFPLKADINTNRHSIDLWALEVKRAYIEWKQIVVAYLETFDAEKAGDHDSKNHQDPQQTKEIGDVALDIVGGQQSQMDGQAWLWLYPTHYDGHQEGDFFGILLENLSDLNNLVDLDNYQAVFNQIRKTFHNRQQYELFGSERSS